MIRYLFGRIAALGRRVVALPRRRRGTAAAREMRTMDAQMPAGRIGPTGGISDGAWNFPGLPPVAPDDFLARAMVSIGIDFDRVAERERLLLHEMHLVCATCHARSRCRRDIGTGDFARRYRHYCPNAERLARLAALRAFRTDTAAPKSPPPEHA